MGWGKVWGSGPPFRPLQPNSKSGVSPARRPAAPSSTRPVGSTDPRTQQFIKDFVIRTRCVHGTHGSSNTATTYAKPTAPALVNPLLRAAAGVQTWAGHNSSRCSGGGARATHAVSPFAPVAPPPPSPHPRPSAASPRCGRTGAAGGRWLPLPAAGRTPLATAAPRPSLPSCRHHSHLGLASSRQKNEAALPRPSSSRTVATPSSSVAASRWRSRRRGGGTRRRPRVSALRLCLLSVLQHAAGGGSASVRAVSGAGGRVGSWEAGSKSPALDPPSARASAGEGGEEAAHESTPRPQRPGGSAFSRATRRMRTEGRFQDGVRE